MEILAPAGNLLNAYSAFKGGADAVYLGGKLFSARASAENFTNEEIKEITLYAHSIKRKVYVTLNTLLFQDEFFEAVNFAKFLYEINIDGVIIQDLGLAHYLHKVIPDLPLNASTQLNCHNIKQAKALIKLGFKRIVLAREVNLNVAKEIKKLGVEVEVFGHGALCVSYSGNCLLSSFIGDRSGNRGRCAQPCRMRYDLQEDKRTIASDKFMISTKDLMTVDSLEKFLEAGVDSLKIEGRLKSNEYIYMVSKTYREALDLVLQNKDLKPIDEYKNNLTKIFSRNFTKGYVLGESPFDVLNHETSNHQGELVGKVIEGYKNRLKIKLSNTLNRLDGIRFLGKDQIGFTVENIFKNRVPVDIAFKGEIIELSGIDRPEKFVGLSIIKTKDNKLIKNIENELTNKIKIPVLASFKAEPNKPISLSIKLDDIEIKVLGDIAQEVISNPTDRGRIISQLSKSGEYPYYFDYIDTKIAPCFIQISSINKLRNEAFEQLRKVLQKTNILEENVYENDKFELTTRDDITAICENNEQQEICSNFGVFSYSTKSENRLENRISNKKEFNNFNELISFPIIKENDGELIASQYCNITNSYALDAYYSLGFNECILSSELDDKSIELLVKDFKSRHNFEPRLGIISYGKLDMMIMKSCPIGTIYKNEKIHCNRCHNHSFELIDRVGAKYRLIGDENCSTRVLLDKPIFILDRLEQIKGLGISNIYVLFTDENKEKASEIITCLRNKTGLFNHNKHTRGHFFGRPL